MGGVGFTSSVASGWTFGSLSSVLWDNYVCTQRHLCILDLFHNLQNWILDRSAGVNTRFWKWLSCFVIIKKKKKKLHPWCGASLGTTDKQKMEKQNLWWFCLHYWLWSLPLIPSWIIFFHFMLRIHYTALPHSAYFDLVHHKNMFPFHLKWLHNIP